MNPLDGKSINNNNNNKYNEYIYNSAFISMYFYMVILYSVEKNLLLITWIFLHKLQQQKNSATKTRLIIKNCFKDKSLFNVDFGSKTKREFVERESRNKNLLNLNCHYLYKFNEI